MFDPGLDVHVLKDRLEFNYGPGITGPVAELRRLDAIRPSLLDPLCAGPDPVYGIAMDVARTEHLSLLKERMLLFGIVAYAQGRLGQEPVRSQGHVHAAAPHCGWSTPELFEIWEGEAIIYAQQSAGRNPGYCTAILAGPADQVVVPPGWAHCVINASPDRRMVFGAWCDRQYGFVYDDVRRQGGLAWFPILSPGGEITWQHNPSYQDSRIDIKPARAYPELGLDPKVSIYRQFAQNPEAVAWVSNPGSKANLWPDFRP